MKSKKAPEPRANNKDNRKDKEPKGKSALKIKSNVKAGPRIEVMD